jgi:hypothetical protein
MAQNEATPKNYVLEFDLDGSANLEIRRIISPRAPRIRPSSQIVANPHSDSRRFYLFRFEITSAKVAGRKKLFEVFGKVEDKDEDHVWDEFADGREHRINVAENGACFLCGGIGS